MGPWVLEGFSRVSKGTPFKVPYKEAKYLFYQYMNPKHTIGALIIRKWFWGLISSGIMCKYKHQYKYVYVCVYVYMYIYIYAHINVSNYSEPPNPQTLNN